MDARHAKVLRDRDRDAIAAGDLDAGLLSSDRLDPAFSIREYSRDATACFGPSDCELFFFDHERFAGSMHCKDSQSTEFII